MTYIEAGLLAGLTAFATTSIAMPVVLRILRKRDILDIPSSRSSHDEPTPRGAGVAQMLGLIASWGLLGGRPGFPVLGAISFGLLGLVDDIRPQKPIIRLVIQLLLAIATMRMILSEPNDMLSGILVLLAGSVLIVLVVNATNFMDGANGMSAIHGVIIGSAYWALLIAESSAWAYTAAGLVGVSLAFLPWNWGVRARIFLGDSGSYLMGAVYALLAIATYQAGLGLVIALAPLSIYLIDVLSTLAIRVRERKPAMSAHRDHIYQQLMRGGFTHGSVSLTVGLFTFAACAIALSSGYEIVDTKLAIFFIGVICLTYLSLPRLLKVPR